MGFYLCQNTKFSFPKIVLSGFCRSTGPVNRAWSRSPGRSTDVHRTCTPGLLEGRSTDLVDLRELLLSGKPRSTGPVDRQRSLFSVPGSGRPGRSTDAPTVRNLTVGRSTGRSTDRPTWLPTASFSTPINWGFWGLFHTRFWSEFWASFFNSLKRFSPLVLEPNTFIQKESLSRVFKSDFLAFSTTTSILISHKYLSFLLIYPSYRRVIVRLFLGDQSVVITKDFIFTLRRRTCVFAIVSSSSESSL